MSTSSTFQTASNKTPFEIAYLNALRAIIGVREDEANGYLNQVRSLLNAEKPKDPVAKGRVGDWRDNLIEVVVKGNLRSRIESLYGDYKYNEPHHITGTVRAPSPWIKDTAVLGMIQNHVAILGDENDVAACQIFLAKTYHTPVLVFKAA